MSALEFPGPGLTMEQWSHIKALAGSLTLRQMGWVSGYFAGFDDAGRGAAALLEHDAPAVQDAIDEALPLRTLTILYATETGNSAALAKALGERFRARGRRTGAHFGEFAIRAGYVPEVTAGRDFNA